MTRSISELALDTIEELKRRGRARGTLGLIQVHEVDEATQIDNWVDVAEEDCQVCLIGGMSSAFNPHHPFEPGYGYGSWSIAKDEDWSDYVEDAEYRAFVDAVIAELPDEYLNGVLPLFTRKMPGKVGETFTDILILANFNDHWAHTDDDIYTLLTRVAEKHK